tara:strand:+ start:1089 stop:1313 length:225 start_codon:yes stop_codon:yes gene_type:complete
MDVVSVGALIYAVMATAFLYNHFTHLFEAQMLVTDKILAHHMESQGLKTTIALTENEIPASMDWFAVDIFSEEE